jgi:uncharacterized protein YgiM (DUF1202 family)
VLPWVLLAVLLWVVLAVYADYRGAVRAARSGGSVEETASVDTTQTEEVGQDVPPGVVATPAKGTVVVLAEGLNLRTQPNTSASVIKRLPANVKLELLGTADGWYQVRDAEGYEGWVAAGGRYTKLEQ